MLHIVKRQPKRFKIHHKLNWISLNNSAQFLSQLKNEESFLIFKHSTRCPVSFAAKNRFERDWDSNPLPLKAFFLDLIQYRELSNLIAEHLNVVHQSPQVILIKNSEVLHHTSHTSINVEKIRGHI